MVLKSFSAGYKLLLIVFSINLGHIFLFPYMSSNFLYYTRYDVWYLVETLDSIIILWRVSIFVLAGVKLTRQTPNSVCHVVGKFQNLCLVQSVSYLLLSFEWVHYMSQDIHHQTRMGRIYIQILRLPLLLWIFSVSSLLKYFGSPSLHSKMSQVNNTLSAWVPANLCYAYWEDISGEEPLNANLTQGSSLISDKSLSRLSGDQSISLPDFWLLYFHVLYILWICNYFPWRD